MAEKFEIIIKNESQSAKNSPIAGDSAQTVDTTGSVGGTSLGTANKAFRGAAAGIVAAVSTVKPYVDKIVSSKVSTVALKTGSQELEEHLSYKVNVGQKIAGFGMSVLAGAAAGGVVGAIGAALVSGITTLVSFGMERAAAQEKLDTERTIENIGLGFMNTRAGGGTASFSGSRMGRQ